MRFQDLYAYRKAFELSMRIFELSKTFPKEEKYSLTDQILRSSRGVCTNIAESYAKRMYPKHFISKLTDSDAENLETQSWLAFALECQYIDSAIFDEFVEQYKQVGRLLYYMINNTGKFGSE